MRRAPKGEATSVCRHAILRGAAVVLLIALYYTLAVVSTLDKSPAYDETAHLTAGYSYWKFNDYRLQPENGNLSQRWVALPLVLSSDVRFPSLDEPAWRASNVDALGQEFLHRSGNNLESMLLRSRVMAALWGVAACLAVYFISLQLFGPMAALLSLFLCALSPTMLAHGPLATSDMCAALWFTLAMWSIARVLERVTPGRLTLSAVATGLLFLAKTSAVLIIPMALVMTVVHLIVRRRLVLAWRGGERKLTSPGQLLTAVTLVTALHAIVAMVLIWAAFGGRYAARSPDMASQEFYVYRTLPNIANRAGTAGKLIARIGEQRLLPESYLYGAAYVLAEARQRAAFLNGDYSARGWVYYFPYTLLVKTPLALFGLLAASAVVILGSGAARQSAGVGLIPNQAIDNGASRGERLFQLAPWLILLGVYWAAAIASNLNIGHRHLLPTYPAMFIVAGAAARYCDRGRIATVLIGLLALCFAAANLRAYQHYLAFFNVLIPRDQAYRCLIDSNLDWGQDLPGLKRWLDSSQAAALDVPVYLSYFGTGSPEYYGIEATRLPINNSAADHAALKGGLYCISATNLQAVYLAAPGRWNISYERDYQELVDLLRRSEDGKQDEAELALTRSGLAELQLARLLAFLRQREPDHQIGYSILIYRLTDADVHEALTGPPAELDPLTWEEREAQEL
jgi:hypothetical protein